MAETITELYRALLGDDAKKWTRIATDTDTVDTLKPKPGVLHPQWVEKTYETGPKDARLTQTRLPDVTLVANKDDPSVIDVLAEAKGTSLHDKPQWFGGKEFWIPQGTIYSEEISIVRDKNQKWNKKHTVQGYHYQLAPKTRMTQMSFAGHLDNMARAAIVCQIAVAKAKVKV